MDDNLYVIFSKTHTKIGKFIRLVTGNEYNHVALATSSNLVPLFSFARRKADKPFSGGFVEESWLRYLYYNLDVKVKIYKIPLTKIKAEEINNLLCQFSENRDFHGYDFKGLILNRDHRTNFTCLSFAQEIIFRVIPLDRKFRRIGDLMNFLDDYFYEEKIVCHREKDRFTWGNDLFNEK